jgi:hypothetical protein
MENRAFDDADEQRNWDRWASVLADLEASLAESVSMVTTVDEAVPPARVWVIPEVLGDLPVSLRGRAERALRAHEGAIERLEYARTATGRHLAALRSVPAHGDGGSVYLDVTG